MKRRFLRSQIAAEVRRAVRLARREDREVCGLLVDTTHAIELLPLRNAARRPGSFRFDERQVRGVLRATKTLQWTVVGTYHSHPVSDASPGRGDIEGTVDDSLMLVIDGISRDVRLWRIKGGRSYPLRLRELVDA